jgi:hypothetical protein
MNTLVSWVVPDFGVPGGETVERPVRDVEPCIRSGVSGTGSQ